MCAVPSKKNGNFFSLSKENKKELFKKAGIVDEKHFKENIFPFLSKVRYVNIAGGEPFIIKNTEYFLEECVKRGFSKDISLKINTNFNRFHIKFLKFFSEFKRCQLDISIDGIGDLYEYIRYPGKWNKIEKNLIELKKCSQNTFICFAVTVQIYNIFSIEEIFKFTNKLEKSINKKIFLCLSCLYRPNFFSVKNLPDDLKNEAVNAVKKASLNIKDWEILDSLNNLIKFIKSNTEKNIKKDFIDYTYFYDKARNQSYSNFLDKRIVKWIKNNE
jgi:glutamate-1-semialdehyde 2,1-aminomutase